jgi:hypothetical protein
VRNLLQNDVKILEKGEILDDTKNQSFIFEPKSLERFEVFTGVSKKNAAF